MAAPTKRAECLTAEATSINSILPQPGGGEIEDWAAAVRSRAAAEAGESPENCETDVSEQLHAVIRTGGKQYRVAPGDLLKVEKLPLEVGSAVDLEVLLLRSGDAIKVGAPLVEGAKVKAEVKAHGRGRKLIVYKFKQRRNYRKKQGHRQAYTELKITEIAG